jgi:PAS domain S-box-containing protein
MEIGLQNTESRYRNLFNQSIIGISQSTHSGRLLWVNQAYAEMYGYRTPEEAVAAVASTGQQLYAHPEERLDVLRILEEMGVMEPREMEVIRRDGTHFIILVSARKIVDAKGSFVCFQAEQIEKNKARQTIGAVLESEARFSTVFHASPLQIAITRVSDTHLIDVNEAWLTQTGFSRSEVLNKSPLVLNLWVHPEDRERMMGMIQEAGIIKNLDFQLRQKSGVIRDMVLSAAQINIAGEACLLSMAFDNTDRKHAEAERETLLKEVLAVHDQLRALASRLQTAQEVERTYIAREIHDEFGQRLTAIKMDLAWLADRIPRTETSMQEKLAGLADLVQDTIQNIRRIASDLRPGLLDDLGLVAAMDWYISDWSSRHGIPVRVHLTKKEQPFSRDVSTALYRILQEALTNTARHALASHVEIRFRMEKDSAMLSIQDDGKGIPQNEIYSPNSIGLLGMRERTRQIGGRIEIERKPGQGTTVTVHLPLNRIRVEAEDKDKGTSL